MSDTVLSWKRYFSFSFWAQKLREKGLFGCCLAVLRKVLRPVKQQSTYLINLPVNLLTFHSGRKPKKVILGVWDYKVIPWSVGDFLVFVETLSVLKLEHNADRVDICVVCDNMNPAGNRGSGNVDSSNFRYYLFNLLPIIGTSPYLGSIFQFDSRSEFFFFLRLNINKYKIYPPINKQLRETFNFYGGATFKEIRDFYKKRGFIPHLNINDYHLSWAYDLYKSECKGLIPVTVSLRNRPNSPERNAVPDAWLGFFDLCKSKFPEVIFVVVGVREEAFEELRRRANVILAKDCGSTLADDFALVRTSLLYMGMDSGLVVLPYFTGVPCLLFGIPSVTRKGLGLRAGSKLEFLTERQKMFFAPFVVSSRALFREFSNLYTQLDVDEWQKKASAQKAKVLSYPTGRGK